VTAASCQIMSWISVVVQTGVRACWRLDLGGGCGLIKSERLQAVVNK
jgi:hypothetical protein